jgi:UDPglucose 6-dehydrogenase
VGTPTMVVLASKCPELDITVVDKSLERISAWNSVNLDDFPLYEPGLDSRLIECRGRNLTFSTDVEEAIDECGIIFVCVNTPTKQSGLGAGRAADLGPWEQAGRTIARAAKTSKIIVEKSTVPVRTAEALTCVISAMSEVEHVILSNPEFLAEGTAIRDLENPDRVLVGGPRTFAGDRATQILIDIYSKWVPTERIIRANVWSSELSKLVSNAFLAQRVSSINSISLICESTGADITEVSRAIGADSRIGNQFLQASVGFGGSCFQKDILNLVYICEELGLLEVAAYWNQVLLMNEHRKLSFVRMIVKSMFNTVSGKRLAIFGFAFKNNTSDTRESPSIRICRELISEGANLSIYDPKVKEKSIREEFDQNRVDVVKSAHEAVDNSHAIIILTEWYEFRGYNYQDLFAKMQKPAFVFDGRNLLDHDSLLQIGFQVRAIGKCYY